MAPKKKRPLRKSDAGLPPSVAAHFTDGERIAGLERALLDEQSVSKQFLAKIQEDAGVIRKLTKQLAAKDKELAADERYALGFAAEIDFVWEELDRYRNRLMEFLRDQAMLPEKLRREIQQARMDAYAEDEANDKDES
jgi:hypothetical protein